MRRLLIVSLLLLFTPLSSINAARYVNLTQLTTEHGLNQNEVNQIMQDSDGYLWITSLQGVNRYDGHRITTIESPSDVLINNSVELMFEDSKGLIWFGTFPQYNFILDKTKNQLSSIKLQAPDHYELREPTLTRAVEDKNTNLWLATYREIFFYNRQKHQFEFINTLDNAFEDYDKNHLIRQLKLLDDQLLVATSNGLYALDIPSKQFRHIKHSPKPPTSEDQNNVKALLINRANQLLVGTVEGFFQLDTEQIKNKESSNANSKVLLESLNIWTVIEKPEFYWLATDLGLYRYFKNGELELIFRYSDTKYNTSDDDIVTMTEDREGNLWFGSRGDGVFKWRPNKAIKQHYWVQSDPGFQLSSNNITAIHQTTDDALWIGTLNGLNRVDPQSKRVTQFLVNPREKEFISDSSIYGFKQHQNKLWINFDNGIRVFDLNQQSEIDLALPPKVKELFSKVIYSFHFIDDENMVIFNADGTFVYHIQEQSLTPLEPILDKREPHKELLFMFDHQDEKDVYYISGWERLVKYNRNLGTFEDFHKLPDSEPFHSQPMDIFRDGDKLWVTYAGVGIYVLDAHTGKEIHFLSEKELNANTVMDIFPDRYGHMWFSTNHGLLRINKSNYSHVFFDAKDGFATSEFNGGSKLIQPDGSVYLGSVKGAFHFDPNAFFEEARTIPSPHITNLSLLSKTIENRYSNYNDYQLELEHDDFGLRVEFSALLFDKPQQVKYRYWIVGDSAIEPSTINKNDLFLPSIETGSNTLYVSAIDYLSGKESPPAKFEIVSKPPPWLSKPALTLYVVLILLLFSSYIYLSRKKAVAKAIAHQKIIESEERLRLALKGGNSGLWDWHAEANKIYEPRLQEINSNTRAIYPLDDKVKAIHADDQEGYQKAWLEFLNSGNDSFSYVYRMQKQDGNWAWYRDMATVTKRSSQGEPRRITGTFTNITKRKRDRDRMQLYSKAFENTRDIVFVLDQNRNVIAANQSFYKTTDYSNEEVIGKSMTFIIDNNGNHTIAEKIFESIHTTNHWEGEANLLKRIAEPLPILINATRFGVNRETENYVFALTDISNQKNAEAELRKLANYDSLTGLPNRTLLLERVNHAIHHCRRRNQRIALFFIDLDRFKRINDTLGHDIGDLLLSSVAQILKQSVREDDTVARLGGDEFVIMLEDIEGLDSVNHIAQDILDKMKQPLILNQNQVSISPSIGISVYPIDGDNADALLKHADIAMYHAKKAGRNNFQYFENSMNKTAKSRLNLEVKLRNALNNNEFYLHYQPQFDIKTRQLRGVEALARWQDNEGNHIAPSEFIPLAEDLGLIIAMSENLMSQAIADLSNWHRQGIEIAMAFNLSAKHLHHYDLNQFLEKLLKEHPIESRLLEFELTESVLMEDTVRVQRLFEKLAEKGIELALDDFGTGYSSLKYLGELPIKKLKIDRSFVSQIGMQKQGEAIIQTIISLANSLNLKTVAEGIETLQQLEFLDKVGTGDAQGFYLARPMEKSELEILLSEPK